jgi:hypothetical protein
VQENAATTGTVERIDIPSFGRCLFDVTLQYLLEADQIKPTERYDPARMQHEISRQAWPWSLWCLVF